MSLPDLTQEQVIERGITASLLLSDARYMSFFQETKQLILESIANTTPEQSAKRENLYYQFNGLSDVLGTMQSWADASEAIIEAQQQEALD